MKPNYQIKPDEATLSSSGTKNGPGKKNEEPPFPEESQLSLLKAENSQLRNRLEKVEYKLSHVSQSANNARSFATYRLKVSPDHKAYSESVFLSASFREITGAENPLNHDEWFSALHPDDRELVLRAQERALETMEFEAVVRQFHPLKNEWRWLHYLSNATPDKHGNAHFFDGIVRDVTEEKRMEIELAKHRDHLEDLVESKTADLIQANLELKREVENRKKSEARYKSALREKEVLIKEIHHRVKNNLQSIANLLDLESMHSPDEKALQALQDCRDRVRAMCMVHRQLYQTKNLSKIPLAPYAENLAAQLFKAYGADPERIKLEINAPEVYLVMDLAIACGLILNELISNSLKYAFSEQKKGVLTLRAQKSGYRAIEMLYSDNGKGLPPGFEPEKAETLGLKMIYYLVEKQLAGKLEHVKGPGCSYHLAFENLEQENISVSYRC